MNVAASDVVIIGGGLIGCATAFELRRRGKRVTVLERGFVGGQSSGVNFGNLRLQGRHPEQMPLSLRAQELWERMEAMLGEDLEFRQGGLLFLARDEAQKARLEKAVEEGRPYLTTEMLGPTEIRRRWPWLRGGAVAASLSPRDATVNSRLVCPAYARAARGLGADIREGVEMRAIEHGAGKFRVTTDRGTVHECEVLLNAAGAWGGAIAEQFGEKVPIFAAGPVQIITEPLAHFLDGVIHVVDGSIIFRQTPRGNMLIAGHPRVPVDAASRRTRAPAHKLAMNLGRMLELAPHLAHLTLLRAWTGIEGYFPDMVPVIGPSGTTPGLFHAFGFCGHGLQIGPAVAICLAELINAGRCEFALHGASITRFARPMPADRHSLSVEFEGSLLDKIGAR
jgi:sarcosine oxidase subunit beta